MRKYIKKIWHILPDGIRSAILKMWSQIIFIKRLFFIDNDKLNDAWKVLKSCNASQKYILMGKPEYGNIGDLAIAHFTKEFAHQIGLKDSYIEIPEDVVIYFHNKLEKYISKDDVLILQGGGNLGDKYRDQEFIRRKVCRHFCNNRIILMPQSIDYGKTRHGVKALSVTQKAFDVVGDITLFARDYQSFLAMKRCFHAKNILLAPDIVLSCIPQKYKAERNNIYICLRNDCESLLDKEFKKSVIDVCERIETIVVGDNIVSSGFDKKNIVQDRLKEIASYKLVITDRLHVMIFSVITNTPCVIIDNSNHKISASYDWIKEYTGYKIVREKEEIYDAVNGLLGKIISNPSLSEKYTDMERCWKNEKIY